MKKILLVVFVITLALCGCSKTASQIKPVTSGISFNAKVSWYNENFVCSGKITGKDEAVFEINEPEDIKGLIIECKGDDVTARFKGLETSYDVSKTPFSFICSEIYSAVRDTWSEETEVLSEGQEFYVEGKANQSDYKMIVAPTGLPLSLEIPNESFKVLFQDVKILKEE
ncbi:MAG: hypothetical protein II802_02010 [Clostridia bacterium]|nr:hypothetical protein [Clostridia bacterium]